MSKYVRQCVLILNIANKLDVKGLTKAATILDGMVAASFFKRAELPPENSPKWDLEGFVLPHNVTMKKVFEEGYSETSTGKDGDVAVYNPYFKTTYDKDKEMYIDNDPKVHLNREIQNLQNKSAPQWQVKNKQKRLDYPYYDARIGINVLYNKGGDGKKFWSSIITSDPKTGEPFLNREEVEQVLDFVDVSIESDLADKLNPLHTNKKMLHDKIFDLENDLENDLKNLGVPLQTPQPGMPPDDTVKQFWYAMRVFAIKEIGKQVIPLHVKIINSLIKSNELDWQPFTASEIIEKRFSKRWNTAINSANEELRNMIYDGNQLDGDKTVDPGRKPSDYDHKSHKFDPNTGNVVQASLIKSPGTYNNPASKKTLVDTLAKCEYIFKEILNDYLSKNGLKTIKLPPLQTFIQGVNVLDAPYQQARQQKIQIDEALTRKKEKIEKKIQEMKDTLFNNEYLKRAEYIIDNFGKLKNINMKDDFFKQVTPQYYEAVAAKIEDNKDETKKDLTEQFIESDDISKEIKSLQTAVTNTKLNFVSQQLYDDVLTTDAKLKTFLEQLEKDVKEIDPIYKSLELFANQLENAYKRMQSGNWDKNIMPQFTPSKQLTP